MQSASVVATLLSTICLGVLVLYVFHLLRRKYFEHKMKLPGLRPEWWNPFGIEYELWNMMRDNGYNGGQAIFNFLLRVTREFKEYPTFMGWVFHVPILFVTTPESMEFVMSSTTLIEKSRFYELLHDWLGTGLLTSEGAKWRTRRKMLTPAFHFKILEDFLDVFNEQGIILADKLKGRSRTGEMFDVTKDVTSCTLDIICETAMGVRIGAQTNPESDYVKSLYTLGESFMDRSFAPYYWTKPAYKLSRKGREFFKSIDTMQSFTMKVIRERRAEIQNTLENDKSTDNDIGRKTRKPFLNLLLERHIKEGDLSLEDIQEEVDTFMFEGHDTTAMGISWTLFLLAQNPEAQRRVYEELEEIFRGDQKRHATNEDLARMKYLECCIKESQRLYPSVPFIGRKFTTDTEFKKKTIPAGTQALLVIFTLHRDEKTFPDPERFDPDRFLPENCEGRHPYAYVPFSAGPRNCIGQKFAMMEEKVVLSWVFRKVALETNLRREDLRVAGELVTRSLNGLSLKSKALQDTVI
ncbi:cytochrome P450 4c3 [Galendromus occidentalis]|uniref:Cytochrome P450 4c3 n=1 Tax=Galendromus occidentalis TaxID=34638 RepID=A0AAJ6VY91_9ACAR|nr:cytochrome P450 4c3 [Galendromus occidentalis]